jgi:hypothetical protein
MNFIVKFIIKNLQFCLGESNAVDASPNIFLANSKFSASRILFRVAIFSSKYQIDCEN